MKIKLAGLFAALGYFWTSVSADNAATCRIWQCQAGLGGTEEGFNRVCANPATDASFTEQCAPNNFLCNVKPNLDVQANCTEFSPLPWNHDMPPGDVCK
jgi:hypothetical protein